jgi:hypothetical protein
MKLLYVLILIMNFNLISFGQGNNEIETIINVFIDQYHVKRILNQYDNQWFVDNHDSLLITRDKFRKAGRDQYNVLIDSAFMNLNKDYFFKQIKLAQKLFVSDENLATKVQIIDRLDKVDKKNQNFFVISYPIFSDTTHKFCFLYYSYDTIGNIDLYMKIDSNWVIIAQTSIWKI